MRTLIAICAAGAFMLLACAQSPAQDAATLDGGCAALPADLRACAPAQCRQPHPIMPGFEIVHDIAGMENGACVYRQSMPQNMSMHCRLSEDGRAYFADQMRTFLDGGRISGRFSTREGPQDNAMTRECEIIDQNGETLPWGLSPG